MTAKYHHCHLQHISPPDSLWTLYKEIEGELAAEQYTRMEIQEYIKDLQSRYKPSPAESSTKGPSIPEASYISPSPDPDSDNMADTIRGERQANKHDTEPSVSSYESDPICSDQSCGREESTPNRMAPVQMRMSRVQPKAVDCVRDATTNSCLSEWQAKHATACSKSSNEFDSYYPNHADVREAPTNYRRNPWEQVKAYYYSDEYHSDDEYSRDPDVDNPYRHYLNPDHSDEYYSDDEYSRDLDIDCTDTTSIGLAPVLVAHTLQAHSTMTYLPSPGNVNQIVARVNPW
jgi:hypothetical protein